MSLTGCISKAGDALRKEDRAAIIARSNALRKEGMKTAEASRQAVRERLDEVAALLEAAKPVVLEQKKDTPRAQIAFPHDFDQAPSVISLLKDADLSSFIHESGHFYLEVMGDLASRIQGQIADGASVADGERGIVEDMGRLLDWFGIKGSESQSKLDEWLSMSLEDRRALHERFARGFELYAFEGKAPSVDLGGIFRRFRSWLMSVYRVLNNTAARDALQVSLTDEVRGVMDRMLATDDQIAEAEAARGMGPLFKTQEQAGMTADEWNAYNDRALDATAQAIENLQARGLKDMQWLQNAKSRKLKELQKRADGLRKEVRIQVRGEVMSRPVYLAWQFLTGKEVDGEKPVKEAKSQSLDPSVDSLLVAIAKLGGINRSSAKRDAGVADDYFKTDVGLFGKPVFRKEGGFSADSMAEQLAELRYLPLDEDGKHSLRDLEDAIADELNGQARYSFFHDFAERYREGAQPLPDDVTFGKLDTARLREMYGNKPEALWRKLSALRMTSEAAGYDPDVVAETFGFTSGDELVKTIAEATPPREVIESLVDERMLTQFGDLATPEGLERATNEAIHNDARARFVAAEFDALEQANRVRKGVPGTRRTVDVLAKAAKEYAAGVIAATRIRDLRPDRYEVAEARAAKNAIKAMKDGDTEKAAAEKRNQMIQSAAARAAIAAQSEMDRARDYFRRFDKPSKSIDRGYQDQIEALLESVDLRKISDKAADRRKSLAAWVEDQRAAGIDPDVPDALLDASKRKAYRDMTVEEVRGLRDTIRNIEHIGRLKRKLLLSKDKREFDAIRADIVASIEASKQGKRREYMLEPKPDSAKERITGYLAEHRKLSSFLRQIDMGNDNGIMYTTVGRSMNTQDAWEGAKNEEFTRKFLELLAPLEAMRGGLTGPASKVYIESIKASMTRAGRLAVVLNYGNADGRARLMSGKLNEGKENWTDAQIKEVMSTLSPAELEFANKAWPLLNELWPEVVAKITRLSGVVPPKVDAVPFSVTASDGTVVDMTGGYYPLKYDSSASVGIASKTAEQVAADMLRGAATRSMTRHGHENARVEGVKHKLRLDLGVMTEHLQEVIHDLAWHEWLIDTNKIFKDQEIAQTLNDYYGPNTVRVIKSSLEAIAGGDTLSRDQSTAFALQLRSNVSRAVMAWSTTTAFLQPFGLFNSMARIGVGPVLQGAASWAGSPKHMRRTIRDIQSKSPMMRQRALTMNRELYEIAKIVKGRSKAMRLADASMFFFTTKMQQMVDVPTWIGAYNKSLVEAPGDEQLAVDQADRAVIESQGSGSTKDLAQVQRNHPFMTQFMSYFSATYQGIVEKTQMTDFKNPVAVAGWAADMALYAVLPALLPSLLMYLMRGGEADEPEDWAKKLAIWQAQYLLAPFYGVREFAGAIQGFDYAGPPAARIVVDAKAVYDQALQGEVDEPLVLSSLKVMGDLTGLPTTQIIRSYKGWKAWGEGDEGAGPQSVLFGPPPRD